MAQKQLGPLLLKKVLMCQERGKAAFFNSELYSKTSKDQLQVLEVFIAELFSLRVKCVLVYF